MLLLCIVSTDFNMIEAKNTCIIDVPILDTTLPYDEKSYLCYYIFVQLNLIGKLRRPKQLLQTSLQPDVGGQLEAVRRFSGVYRTFNCAHGFVLLQVIG